MAKLNREHLKKIQADTTTHLLHTIEPRLKTQGKTTLLPNAHSRLKLKKQHVFILFSLITCISTLENISENIRYLKYAIGPLSIALWAASGFKKPEHNSTIALSFLYYSAWLLVSLTWGDLASGGKDIFFIASYAIPLTLFYTPKLSIDTIFSIYTLFFILSVPGQDINKLSFSESIAPLEGASSFVFGAFAISFAVQRKKIGLLIATIFLILTMKRIALIGVFACLLIWILPYKIKEKILNNHSILALNLAVLALTISLTTGFFNDEISAITGKGVAEITLGRTAHYFGVVYDILSNPYSLIIGNGAGSAYEKAIIEYSYGTPTQNLHSDTLKIFYEAGILVFTLFFLYAGKSKSTNSRLILVYVSILFATDNTLIYSGVMFFIGYIAMHLEETQQTRKSSPA